MDASFKITTAAPRLPLTCWFWLNSRLDKSKLVEAGFTPLPTWQDVLSCYLKEIEQ